MLSSDPESSPLKDVPATATGTGPRDYRGPTGLDGGPDVTYFVLFCLSRSLGSDEDVGTEGGVGGRIHNQGYCLWSLQSGTVKLSLEDLSLVERLYFVV